MTAARFVTVSELAKRWDISRSTLWHQCEEGRIPAMKVGRSWRIPLSHVEAEEAAAFERVAAGDAG